MTGRFVAKSASAIQAVVANREEGFWASVQDWSGILSRGVGADASGSLAHFPTSPFPRQNPERSFSGQISLELIQFKLN
jgi:hypothetical protein